MAIQFYLTSAGRNAALNAASLGLNVSLTHIAVGSGKYDPSNPMSLTHTALVSEIERYPLNGGSVEPNSQTLRFIANIEPSQTADGYEIGLITDQGVLFAIAATTSNTPLIRLVANIISIVTFGMVISNVNLSNVIINIDPNTPISVALMNEHLAHLNPHPQYVLRNEVGENNNGLSEKFFPIYNCIISSDHNYNPAVALQELLGENTKWRKLPFIPHGVSSSSDVGKISYLENGADIAALGMFIWQRMPNDYVPPSANIFYASFPLSFASLFHYGPFFAFDRVNSCSFYVVRVSNYDGLPIEYKIIDGGVVVDRLLEDAKGLLYLDDDGFGLIPTRIKNNAYSSYFFRKTELILSGQYQHVCSGGDQRYRFLDLDTSFPQMMSYTITIPKKYVKVDDLLELIVNRISTNAEVRYIAFGSATISSLAPDNGIDVDIFRAVDCFDLMPDSSVGVELFESYDGSTIEDRIYKLLFAENELEKKIVLRVKNRQILNRMNILTLIHDSNNLGGLGLEYSNNFLLEKNIPQPTYFLSYNILGLTLTISLETTLIEENTHIAWNITNYEGDPITPVVSAGEFVIDEDGQAEVEFTIQNGGDAFSFVFGLTGRDEYIGVKRE